MLVVDGVEDVLVGVGTGWSWLGFDALDRSNALDGSNALFGGLVVSM